MFTMDVMQQCNKTPLYCLPLCHHTNKFVIHISTLLGQYLSSITNFGDLGSEWHSAIFLQKKEEGCLLETGHLFTVTVSTLHMVLIWSVTLCFFPRNLIG